MSSVNNIERLREGRGWKRPQLAKLMNTSPQQVERLEKGGRRLTQDWIDRAAVAFDVSPAAIITPDHGELVPPPGGTDPAEAKPAGARGVIEAGDDSAVTLRSFDLSYSMGPGTNIDDYVEEGTYEFDAGMLAKLTHAPADRLFVARADGDSMFPTLLSDDLVVIDTTQRVVNLRDRIWACSIYGAGAIKRLRPAAKGKMEIISDNPAVKDDLVDAEDIHIVGRVIWLGRRI
ncbi:transcriptional regulator with XRE-family HTH domain [Novosphingobium fluoreni]|uniref:Transcriptional regulator with XRE-family HTH domain n=1 Tax=Novosphingobium fluoreni TaxID=1391222 RepID=A0A7W6BZG5_9SPHN|nr:transcriptional regulator with XRE-family HTH domain [Novosphingobium fluoreni]